MHSFTLALLAIAASVVSAQAFSELPNCALNPIIAAIGSTGCQETDIKCICSSTSYLENAEQAIEAACSPADILEAERVTAELCNSVGLKIGDSA